MDQSTGQEQAHYISRCSSILACAEQMSELWHAIMSGHDCLAALSELAPQGNLQAVDVTGSWRQVQHCGPHAHPSAPANAPKPEATASAACRSPVPTLLGGCLAGMGAPCSTVCRPPKAWADTPSISASTARASPVEHDMSQGWLRWCGKHDLWEFSHDIWQGPTNTMHDAQCIADSPGSCCSYSTVVGLNTRTFMRRLS